MKTDKVFNATVAGQKALCSHALRIATLAALNKAVRKLNPAEAWSDDYINSVGPDCIDSTMENLRCDYNRLLEANKTNPAI